METTRLTIRGVMSKLCKIDGAYQIGGGPGGGTVSITVRTTVRSTVSTTVGGIVGVIYSGGACISPYKEAKIEEQADSQPHFNRNASVSTTDACAALEHELICICEYARE